MPRTEEMPEQKEQGRASALRFSVLLALVLAAPIPIVAWWAWRGGGLVGAHGGLVAFAAAVATLVLGLAVARPRLRRGIEDAKARLTGADQLLAEWECRPDEWRQFVATLGRWQCWKAGYPGAVAGPVRVRLYRGGVEVAGRFSCWASDWPPTRGQHPSFDEWQRLEAPPRLRLAYLTRHLGPGGTTTWRHDVLVPASGLGPTQEERLRAHLGPPA